MLEDELKTKLVMALTSMRDRGKTPTEAVENILRALGAHYHDVARISVLNGKLIGGVLSAVYQDALTAHELAVLLRNMHFAPPEVALGLHTSFPTLNAQELGAWVLNADVYPQCEKDGLREALHYLRFSDAECEQALEALYPS